MLLLSFSRSRAELLYFPVTHRCPVTQRLCGDRTKHSRDTEMSRRSDRTGDVLAMENVLSGVLYGTCGTCGLRDRFGVGQG